MSNLFPDNRLDIQNNFTNAINPNSPSFQPSLRREQESRYAMFLYAIIIFFKHPSVARLPQPAFNLIGCRFAARNDTIYVSFPRSGVVMYRVQLKFKFSEILHVSHELSLYLKPTD